MSAGSFGGAKLAKQKRQSVSFIEVNFAKCFAERSNTESVMGLKWKYFVSEICM